MNTTERRKVLDTWVVVQEAGAKKRLPTATGYIRYFGTNAAQAVKYGKVRQEMRPSGLKKKIRETRN